ncbi:MAG: DASS family sodium-coupled anion symporter [Acidobacteriota bacterium]|nr:MAG: DASS family sodium-coupled anion symporter [Acidobacteriota bacterium]
MASEKPTSISIRRLAVCLAIGAAAWVVPAPEGLTAAGWHVLGVFAATIASFVIRPLPMGAMVLLGLIALSVTGTLPYKSMLEAFGNITVWLVVAAFLLAGAVGRTGFGRRIALGFMAFLGRSTLGLGYSVCASEVVLGPIVPSNTARGGGIIAPIIRSLCVELNSHPSEQPERAGRYLTLVGAHANLVTAAMFLTGMAANPLLKAAAEDVFQIDFGFCTWAIGALVPGLVSLGLLPLLMYKLSPPTLKDSRAAQEKARSDLKAMGRWTRGQIVMAAVFVLLLVLWSTKPIHGMGTGLVAWLGVCILLVSGTEGWQDVTGNARAWDTLFWLGGLLAMAGALKSEGVVGWFAQAMQDQVAGLGSITLVLILALIYFYSMYGFSMLTAHISALATAFFAIAASAGAPPMLTIALLAYFSNLCACTTNYSTGPVIIYFGLGYVPSQSWFKVGALVSLFHLAVWLGVGMAWWKILGWW